MSNSSKFKGASPVFTRGSSSAALGLHTACFSLRDIKRMSFETVVVEKGGKVEVIEGIRASAIITKEVIGEYEGILHWPKLTKNRKRASKLPGGWDPNLIAVIEDSEGNLILREKEKAIPIIDGDIPQGFSIVFIPPQKKRKH